MVEIIEDHNTDTYRAVYTVKFAGVIYVLHAFQKTKKGSEIPQAEMAIVRRRLKAAEADHRQQKGSMQ